MPSQRYKLIAAVRDRLDGFARTRKCSFSTSAFWPTRNGLETVAVSVVGSQVRINLEAIPPRTASVSIIRNFAGY